MRPFTLEIACFSVHSALQACHAGADRIELCENPSEGGTTPSFGSLKLARQKINIPVFPIIRPRGGDFLYNALEFEIMKQDIGLCKSLGFAGVVLGLLNADGSIDEERTTELVDLADPMEVTFHRAFDRCDNPIAALETIILAGCKRLLTSGQVHDVNQNPGLVNELIELAQNRIIIMPGSGVRADKITRLAQATGAVEFHSSARKPVESAMKFRVESMHEDLSHQGVDSQEIRQMKLALTRFFAGN